MDWWQKWLLKLLNFETLLLVFPVIEKCYIRVYPSSFCVCESLHCLMWVCLPPICYTYLNSYSLFLLLHFDKFLFPGSLWGHSCICCYLCPQYSHECTRTHTYTKTQKHTLTHIHTYILKYIHTEQSGSVKVTEETETQSDMKACLKFQKWL